MIEKTKLEIKEIVCGEYLQYLRAGQLPCIRGSWIDKEVVVVASLYMYFKKRVCPTFAEKLPIAKPCRPRSVCADYAGWHESIRLADALSPLFIQHGSCCFQLERRIRMSIFDCSC